MSTETTNAELPKEYTAPEGLRTLANYLRGANGVKVKSGIEHEKRVDYFKGKRLIECIVEGKKWPRSIPRVTDHSVAMKVADKLLQANFYHHSEKVKEKKGYLKISPNHIFEEKGYYTWMFAGNMMWSNIATGLVIAAVIAFTLLPIWPDAAKKVLWYCSVTFLIGTLSFCLIRLIAFVVMWLVGYEFWIFPRLFDESLSFQDSFKPVYTFEKGSNGQGYYRFAMVIAFAGFVYWATTQPTEFDGYLQAQKVFIDDLYSGKLLADVAFDPREHMDRSKKVPSLEDLLKELEADEKVHITDKESDNSGAKAHFNGDNDDTTVDDDAVDQQQSASDNSADEATTNADDSSATNDVDGEDFLEGFNPSDLDSEFDSFSASSEEL